MIPSPAILSRDGGQRARGKPLQCNATHHRYETFENGQWRKEGNAPLDGAECSSSIKALMHSLISPVPFKLHLTMSHLGDMFFAYMDENYFLVF